MIYFINYDRVTGRVTQYGTISDETVAEHHFQLFPDHVRLEEPIADYTRVRFVNDQLVETGPPLPQSAEVQGMILHELNRSDYTQLPDSPLTAEQRQAWRIYRNALRIHMDLPVTRDTLDLFPTDPKGQNMARSLNWID